MGLPRQGFPGADVPRGVRPETRERLLHGSRNDLLFDLWSLAHLAAGILLGWVMDPYLALVLLILWEPLEIFVLHPLVLRLTGRVFGHESWRNSMSDIVFDAAGVALGRWGLARAAAPPFHLGG